MLGTKWPTHTFARRVKQHTSWCSLKEEAATWACLRSMEPWFEDIQIANCSLATVCLHKQRISWVEIYLSGDIPDIPGAASKMPRNCRWSGTPEGTRMPAAWLHQRSQGLASSHGERYLSWRAPCLCGERRMCAVCSGYNEGLVKARTKLF
jgi:hypothetical protein